LARGVSPLKQVNENLEKRTSFASLMNPRGSVRQQRWQSSSSVNLRALSAGSCAESLAKRLES
jgi:hypothetical protein